MNELITLPKDITKETLRQDAQIVIDSVLNGDIEPMRAHLHIKALEEMIKTIKAGIKDAVLNDADKYVNDESFPAKISISNTGDRIRYEDDQEYCDIKAALKAREEKLKRAYKNGAPIVDADTGEMIPVCGSAKESELVVKVEFRK